MIIKRAHQSMVKASGFMHMAIGLSYRVEPQVLDYQTQQMKLFPAIATSYAFFFTGLAVKELYEKIFVAIEAGDSSRLKEVYFRLTWSMQLLVAANVW